MNPIDMQKRVIEATRNHTRYVHSLINREFLKIDVPITKTPYKIAILFSGGLRNFYATQEWANKFLIDPLKADVFFHGWSNKDGVSQNEQDIKNYHNLKSFKILDLKENPIPVPEIMKTKFPEHIRRGIGLIQADHILGQLFNIRNSYDLMEKYEQENSIKYDIAIRVRPDVFWYATPEDKDLMHVMNKSCIATPQKYMSVICGGYINDQFAMGQTDIMKVFTRMFDCVEEYAKTAPDNEATEYYVTTHILKNNIALHNIDMAFMLDYPSDYTTEKGFNPATYRHVDQNDSSIAQALVKETRRKNDL